MNNPKQLIFPFQINQKASFENFFCSPDNHYLIKKLSDFVSSNNANELINQLKNQNTNVKRSFVLNETTKYLKSNNMLPAICFIFSRKAVEECANEISVPLFDDDDTTTSIIADECHKILLKLPNYREYINLPEYHNLLKILKKGIAIHHSGIMPIFREMVEILFAKGYIKMLFATETFAVGINTVSYTHLPLPPNREV